MPTITAKDSTTWAIGKVRRGAFSRDNDHPEPTSCASELIQNSATLWIDATSNNNLLKSITIYDGIVLMRGLFGALALFFLSTTAMATPMEKWDYNGWSGGAFSFDNSGQFSHCVTWMGYKSGITLYFSVVNNFGQIVIGFSNPEWRLTVNEQYKLKLSVDNFFSQDDVKANATKTDMVTIGYEPKSSFFRTLQKGLVLKVKLASASFDFDLKNSSGALQKVLDCVSRHQVKSATTSNPFISGSGSNPFDSSGDKTPPPAAKIEQPFDVVPSPAAAKRGQVGA